MRGSGKYLENDTLVIKKGDWRKSFNIGSLNQSLKAYENEILKENAFDFLNKFRFESYSHHASSVHNGFGRFVRYCFMPENMMEEDSELLFNLGGLPNKKII